MSIDDFTAFNPLVMKERYIFGSLTRISDLPEHPFDVAELPFHDWEGGDYVVGEVDHPVNTLLKIELANGRMVEVAKGDKLVGALGVRHATLEATGTWQMTGADKHLHVLTGAGLLGKLTSKSAFLPPLISLKYLGHVQRQGTKVRMMDFLPKVRYVPYQTPTIMLIGTSMSAGKTTVGRMITRLLKRDGYKVVGAKITGAGRYRDTLSYADAGADTIYDFVDVGLPSTVVEPERYEPRLKQLLSMMNSARADVAVVEVGASPMEPYNGDLAYEAIKDQVIFSVLCASDPYSVYGLMRAYGLEPDVVSGVTTNTLAGKELIERLCKVQALNIIDPEDRDAIERMVLKRLPRQASVK
jgi:hypothetical protein